VRDIRYVILSPGVTRRTTVKKILRALAITGAVALLFVPFAVGTPEYTKKENKQCVYCHTAYGKPDLNDAGKYYKDHGSFDGYREKK
jgi:hypothetical protein